MVIRMRHTRSHTNMRRSHHALKDFTFVDCPKCKAPKLPHMVCKNCGEYKGMKVIDVLAKLDKKARKQKEKELKAKEQSKADEKPLKLEELSQK